MAENTLSGSAGRPRPMARPFVGTRATQPSPASRRGPQQVVPPFGPPGRATPESALEPLGSTVAVLVAAVPMQAAAAVQTGMPDLADIDVEVVDTAEVPSSVVEAGDDWFAAASTAISNDAFTEDLVDSPEVAPQDERGPVDAETAYVGHQSDDIDTQVAEHSQAGLVAPAPENSWQPATPTEELTAEEFDSESSRVERESDFPDTNSHVDTDPVSVPVAPWRESEPTDQTTVDVQPQPEHDVVAEESWQSEATPPQEDGIAPSDQPNTRSIEEQPQTSELTALSDYTGVQFDHVATTEPAALISSDLTGPEPDPNRDRIALTLERLATRIRSGEIALSQSANAGSETAVLASVLTTLLSDAI